MKRNGSLSIAEQIKSRIQEMQLGRIFFAEDFTVCDRQAVRVILSRLVKDRTIIRLGPGIYQVPRYSHVLETMTRASVEDIAFALAEKEKARIKVSGSYALYKLGFSTQVPTQTVFLTDGSSRRIMLADGRVLVFKKTTAKNLSYQSHCFSLIVSALRELGETGVTQEIFTKIERYLENDDRAILAEDMKLAPEWIQKKLVPVIRK